VATTQAALERFAGELDIPVPVLFRFARALKEAIDAGGKRRDLWPLGGFGGGKRAAHVLGPHLANLILSLFAQQPSDAVAVMDKLRSWAKGPRLDAEGKVMPDRETGYATLGQYVLLPIEALARHDEATRTQWATDRLEQRFCVDLDGGLAFVTHRTARMFWPGEEIFHASGKNPFDDEGNRVDDQGNRVARIVEVPLNLTVVAADLLADTMAKRGGLNLTASGKAQAMAEPENETAPDPARSEAATRTTDRLRDNGNRVLNIPEGKAEIAKSQALLASRSRSAPPPLGECAASWPPTRLPT
jgi:hypothetical protein